MCQELFIFGRRVRVLIPEMWASFFFITLYQTGAPAVERLEFIHLDQAQGGIDIGKIVFIAGLVHFVIPGAFLSIAFPAVLAHAVQTQTPEPFGLALVIQSNDPPFPCGDVLGGEEAETGEVSQPSDLFPVIFRTQCMGGVLDHPQFVLPC